MQWTAACCQGFAISVLDSDDSEQADLRGGRADPIQLAHGLLGLAVARGARLFEGEAVAFDAAGRSVGVRLASDGEIEARSVVLATGYVMPDIVQSTVHAVSSS